jgi:hypothetical protein
MRIDDKGLGNAVNAPVDPHPPVDIRAGPGVRVAHLIEPVRRIVRLVLVIEPVDRNRPLRFQSHQQWMLFPARHAPGREDIDE